MGSLTFRRHYLPLEVTHQVVAVDLECPVVSKHCLGGKETPTLLRVWYREVEECKGDRVAKDDNVCLKSVRGHQVRDAWVRGAHAWPAVSSRAFWPECERSVTLLGAEG